MDAILNGRRHSMSQAAKLLGVHVATVWRWTLHGVRGRRLRTVSVGGRRYVLDDDLTAFLSQGNVDRHADGSETLRRRADDAGRILDGVGVGERGRKPRRSS
ncbi:MAG: helix-turn-helix domain-containing protein [Chloroflexota bacterium]|nr:helix-turn-helix domain-containing protein [Chloroflexota bacterium]